MTRVRPDRRPYDIDLGHHLVVGTDSATRIREVDLTEAGQERGREVASCRRALRVEVLGNADFPRDHGWSWEVDDGQRLELSILGHHQRRGAFGTRNPGIDHGGPSAMPSRRHGDD